MMPPPQRDTADLNVLQSEGMAFIVGIENYGADSVQYMAGDATEFANKLINDFGYPPSNVYIITATTAGVRFNDGGKIVDVPGKLTKEALNGEFVSLSETKRKKSGPNISFFITAGMARKTKTPLVTNW